MTKPKQFFVAGDIYGVTTGGTLCDRLILKTLQGKGSVTLLNSAVHPGWPFFKKPGLAGFLANLRNSTWVFPRNSVVWIDNGTYRDIFLAAWIWRMLYSIKVINILYHLDSNVARGWRTSYRRLIEKCLLSASDEIITISQSTLAQAVVRGIPKSQCSIMSVSRHFDPHRIPPPQRKAETRDEMIFFFVGTIDPRKGLTDALDALTSYQGTTKLRYRCAGDYDPESGYYRELHEIMSKHPHVKVDFLGRITHEKLQNEFESADAFLFPSYWEGYGIAIEEAFCFGLPVIAYAAGSIPELFSKIPQEGWLVPLHDKITLAKSVAECIENPSLRIERGFAAYSRALKLVSPFDWDAYVEGILHKLNAPSRQRQP
jgi:glycosyltransferase involved in cell wall biosynthesis